MKRLLSAVVLASVLSALPSLAAPEWERALDNDWWKVSVDLRARVELAHVDGDDPAQAYTVRTRLGLGTKPWHGLSAYAEVENLFAIDGDQYWDTASTPNGRSPIADPEETELNQGYLRYEPEGWPASLTAGRQRLVLDDHRFVGDVGWRQNQQTFDAAWATARWGEVDLGYGYVWDVRRISGDDGPPANEDFESDSHLVHLRWEGGEALAVSAFAYLLDFDNSPGNSADSLGFRVTGARPLGSGWQLDYAGSYAWQADAGDNPVDYTASYVAAELGLRSESLGRLAVGYELLGSDDGEARFVTPLATGHKFNGFADAFLDNGGPDGLQDLYVSLSPELPWQLTGSAIYHTFWSDEGAGLLGHEIDFVLSRPLGEHFTVLTKGAWFDGRGDAPADRWRFWLELTFRY